MLRGKVRLAKSQKEPSTKPRVPSPVRRGQPTSPKRRSQQHLGSPRDAPSGYFRDRTLSNDLPSMGRQHSSSTYTCDPAHLDSSLTVGSLASGGSSRSLEGFPTSSYNMAEVADTIKHPHKVGFLVSPTHSVHRSEREIPAYGEYYGKHPDTFDFAADGSMVNRFTGMTQDYAERWYAMRQKSGEDSAGDEIIDIAGDAPAAKAGERERGGAREHGPVFARGRGGHGGYQSSRTSTPKLCKVVCAEDVPDDDGLPEHYDPVEWSAA